MIDSFSIGSLKIPHRLLMAPMCGITIQPFRQILKEYGAGLVFTQMVSAKALTMGDEKTKKLLSFHESERPIAFQLFGNNADVLAEAARIAQDMGPDLLDLNMGCPARKIVNDGGGSALLKDPILSREVFQKMRKVLRIPFTVKMRSGWDKDAGDALEIAKIAEECGVDAMTLHARTKAQGYSGKADWDLIRIFKTELKIPVIGNGDVVSLADVYRMREETGCDAVMVGRKAVGSPWFFRNYLKQVDDQPSSGELKELILKQYEMFFGFYGESHGLRQMRKYLCSYTKGIPHGASFRSRVISTDHWPQAREALHEFLPT